MPDKYLFCLKGNQHLYCNNQQVDIREEVESLVCLFRSMNKQPENSSGDQQYLFVLNRGLL